MRVKSTPSNDPYAYAERTLQKAIRNPEKFAQALALAKYHCGKIRAYEWPEAEMRQRGRDAKESWDSVNAAALKIAEYFETINPLTGFFRLSQAWKQVAKAGIKNMPSPPSGAQFAALLRALSDQTTRTDRKGRVDHGYTFGPLRIGKSSRRMPSRDVALTVALAHIFARVMAHKDPTPLMPNDGEAIRSGRAWQAAADFASAALVSDDVDANAAKKYLRDHRGHLYLRLVPKPRGRPVVRPRAQVT